VIPTCNFIKIKRYVNKGVKILKKRASQDILRSDHLTGAVLLQFLGWGETESNWNAERYEYANYEKTMHKFQGEAVIQFSSISLITFFKAELKTSGGLSKTTWCYKPEEHTSQ
jgi:ABC-type transport system involved in Fe-S cluster assembly fused permease/ATPase subunit